MVFFHLEKYLILSPVLHMLMTPIFVSCLALLQVKKIMNSVFQSLRGEFELEETYSGRTVLGVVMTTIKVQQQEEIKGDQCERTNLGLKNHKFVL